MGRPTVEETLVREDTHTLFAGCCVRFDAFKFDRDWSYFKKPRICSVKVGFGVRRGSNSMNRKGGKRVTSTRSE
jgi:hypothetical protein